MTTSPERPAPLRPGLLAVKGKARPASRRNDLANALVEDDDLDWNDFGPDPTDVPPVLHQRAQLQTLAASNGAPEVLTVTLDAERLWRLRIAAATRGQTVEACLIDAIDLLLPPDGAPIDLLPKVQP